MRFLFLILVVGIFPFRNSKGPSFSIDIHPSTDLSQALAKFQKVSLPYQTTTIKPVRLHDGDSSFIKSIMRSKSLIAVTDTSANVWQDADDEGKVRIEMPDLIGAGAQIRVNDAITLLEITDMYELKGESESNKQGVFPRTTFLCTVDKSGKLISAVVANFSMSSEHGSVNRWSCKINSLNDIVIKEYGNRKEEKYNYTFATTCKIVSDGKIIKVRSERVAK